MTGDVFDLATALVRQALTAPLARDLEAIDRRRAVELRAELAAIESWRETVDAMVKAAIGMPAWSRRSFADALEAGWVTLLAGHLPAIRAPRYEELAAIESRLGRGE